MRIIFELPFYSPVVGGINETIKIAYKLGAAVRFQRKSEYQIDIPVEYSIGMPDSTFPACDVCITYSDTPYLDKLLKLPQIKRKVLVYMLSYGMSPNAERSNALNKDCTCLCSTKKIEDAIIKDGGSPIRVGFALDMGDMVNRGQKRNNFLAIMYNDMASKRYDLAVRVADMLYDNGIIDGVIVFGGKSGYEKHRKPKGLVQSYGNASRESIIQLFNRCKCFLMPSVSEGLSLTPIEATLCGCVSVICDGAIGEIFFGDNCCICMPDDVADLASCVVDIMGNYDKFVELFKPNMQSVVNDYTWDKFLTRLAPHL